MLNHTSLLVNNTAMVSLDFTGFSVVLVETMNNEMMNIFVQMINRTGTPPATGSDRTIFSTLGANLEAKSAATMSQQAPATKIGPI